MAIGTATAILGSAVLGGVLGMAGSKKQADAVKDANAAQIEANKPDPRVQAMLYGDDQNGLLNRYQGLLDKPQNAGVATYGQQIDNLVGNYGAGGMVDSMRAAGRLQDSNFAAPTMGAATVNAPQQNGMNLTGSYDKFINGTPGANPYLTGAIQKGINQSTNAFGNMITDAKQATQDVLGGIRGGAVAAGQYGGSRQGIAEGKAIDSMNTQLGRAASQFGQNNTDAAVAAQAGAYDTDSSRALAATQGLGAQQYGVASQNGAQQQGANQANLNAGLTTNALNSANTATGIGASQGLLNTAYGQAGAQDQYDINKATNVNGLLSPYLSKNGTPTQLATPYANNAGAALGGAATGIGLYNQLKSGFTTPDDYSPTYKSGQY